MILEMIREELENKGLLEPIEESAIAFEPGMSIEADSTFNRNGYYFKVFDHIKPRCAKRVIRINLEKPEYEYHTGNIWEMSNQDKKQLIALLNKDDNWNKLKTACMDMKGGVPDKHILDLEMPDYMQLKFNSNRGNKFKRR